MESAGIPGRMPVSEATNPLVKDRFVFTERGAIELCGPSVNEAPVGEAVYPFTGRVAIASRRIPVRLQLTGR
jgi:hypothetical protein